MHNEDLASKIVEQPAEPRKPIKGDGPDSSKLKEELSVWDRVRAVAGGR